MTCSFSSAIPTSPNQQRFSSAATQLVQAAFVGEISMPEIHSGGLALSLALRPGFPPPSVWLSKAVNGAPTRPRICRMAETEGEGAQGAADG